MADMQWKKNSSQIESMRVTILYEYQIDSIDLLRVTLNYFSAQIQKRTMIKKRHIDLTRSIKSKL